MSVIIKQWFGQLKEVEENRKAKLKQAKTLKNICRECSRMGRIPIHYCRNCFTDMTKTL